MGIRALLSAVPLREGECTMEYSCRDTKRRQVESGAFSAGYRLGCRLGETAGYHGENRDRRSVEYPEAYLAGYRCGFLLGSLNKPEDVS